MMSDANRIHELSSAKITTLFLLITKLKLLICLLTTFSLGRNDNVIYCTSLFTCMIKSVTNFSSPFVNSLRVHVEKTVSHTCVTSDKDHWNFLWQIIISFFAIFLFVLNVTFPCERKLINNKEQSHKILTIELLY